KQEVALQTGGRVDVDEVHVDGAVLQVAVRVREGQERDLAGPRVVLGEEQEARRSLAPGTGREGQRGGTDGDRREGAQDAAEGGGAHGNARLSHFFPRGVNAAQEAPVPRPIARA